MVSVTALKPNLADIRLVHGGLRVSARSLVTDNIRQFRKTPELCKQVEVLRFSLHVASFAASRVNTPASQEFSVGWFDPICLMSVLCSLWRHKAQIWSCQDATTARSACWQTVTTWCHVSMYSTSNPRSFPMHSPCAFNFFTAEVQLPRLMTFQQCFSNYSRSWFAEEPSTSK